jgi:hypothetical protein
MIREVAQGHDQEQWDAGQRLDEACRRLRRIDVELVEWTVSPAGPHGKRVAAEILITDRRHPLTQLARLLRQIAAEVEQLARQGPPVPG